MIKRANPEDFLRNEETGEVVSTKDGPIHIQYERVVKSRRIFSSIIDFLVFCLFFLIVFTSTRAIVNVTPNYINAKTEYETIQIDSGLYKKMTTNNNKIYPITDYYNNLDLDSFPHKKNLVDGINQFIDYSNGDKSSKNVDVAKQFEDYKKACVNKAGTKLFIESGETYIEDSSISAADFITYAYEPFINDKCVGYLVSNFPSYLANQRIISNYLLFVEVPISAVVSSFITFYLFGLIFKRGRKSLGKLMFNYGLVNKEYLNVSLSQFTLRFLFILFVEIILSIVTFGIPLIISGSFMVFSKKAQPLHDYLFKIDAVDTTTSKIYYSYEEILLSRAECTKHVDFKLK